MSSEFDIVNFLTTNLPSTLGDEYSVVPQPRFPLPHHGSYFPDLLVTNTSSGERYVIEIKSTVTPTVTASIDFPLAAEASVKRMQESLASPNSHFVLVTPFNLSPSQKQTLENREITVINSGSPPEVLEKLVGFIEPSSAKRKSGT